MKNEEQKTISALERLEIDSHITKKYTPYQWAVSHFLYFEKLPNNIHILKLNEDLETCLKYLHSEKKNPQILRRLLDICLPLEKARCLYKERNPWPNEKTMNWIFYGRDSTVFDLIMSDLKLMKLLEDTEVPTTKPKLREYFPDRSWDSIQSYSTSFDVGEIS